MSQLEDFISIKSNENIENIATISEAYLLENYNIKNSLICEKYTISFKKDIFELISKCIAQNLLIKYSLMVLYNLFEEDYGELSQEEKFDIFTFLQGKTNSSEFLYYTDAFNEKLHFFNIILTFFLFFLDIFLNFITLHRFSVFNFGKFSIIHKTSTLNF